ncbi:MAG: BtpA/SgcQ family protein [Pseudomonadota bacterium]
MAGMTGAAMRSLFGVPGPAVLPVIHVQDSQQTRANIAVAVGEGAAGCFLINHDFGIERFLPIIRDARAAHPALWLGVNFLAVTGRDAFPVLGALAAEGCRIDAYWADDARIDEHAARQIQAAEIDAVRAASGWRGLYFGGTAFKKQRPVQPTHWAAAAALAAGHMDAVTTSGAATGIEAGADKIAVFRRAVGDRPLALASGITPENAATYREADAFLVATGINRVGDFYRIDPARLAALMRATRRLGEAR